MSEIGRLSPSFRERVAIDCKDSGSRVALSSASEAKGCAFLLISLLNRAFLTGSSSADREIERERQKERKKTMYGREF